MLSFWKIIKWSDKDRKGLSKKNGENKKLKGKNGDKGKDIRDRKKDRKGDVALQSMETKRKSGYGGKN